MPTQWSMLCCTAQSAPTAQRRSARKPSSRYCRYRHSWRRYRAQENSLAAFARCASHWFTALSCWSLPETSGRAAAIWMSRLKHIGASPTLKDGRTAHELRRTAGLPPPLSNALYGRSARSQKLILAGTLGRPSSRRRDELIFEHIRSQPIGRTILKPRPSRASSIFQYNPNSAPFVLPRCARTRGDKIIEVEVAGDGLIRMKAPSARFYFLCRRGKAVSLSLFWMMGYGGRDIFCRSAMGPEARKTLRLAGAICWTRFQGC